MKILQPKIFPENIIAGVTTAELNIQKQKDQIALAKLISVDFGNMIFQKQVHSDRIAIAKKSEISESDALITSSKGLILNVSIADCAAVLIFDKKNYVCAGVHSGWRGTKAKILKKTIEKLISEFGSKAQDILLYFSPMASVEEYEVGKEFLEYFPKSIRSKSGKYYFDNKKQLLLQISEFNIPMENFEFANICTIANKSFHSFRRDRSYSGRMSAFIGLK